MWQQGVLVFYFPWQQRLQGLAYHKGDTFQRKTVALNFWKDGVWRETTATVLWNESDIVESVRHLVNSWIACMQDEQVISYALWLRHVAVTSLQNEVILSFSRSLCHPEWPVQQKLFFIEGLLKTIRSATSSLEYITFLVQDDYMVDGHLDFNRSWPIDSLQQDYN